jgi:putative endonuclease
VANTRQRGTHWERVAESFLNGRGLRTLDRNFQVRRGEIDLVLRDGSTLVFAEVRYRGNPSHGSGADSVTPEKQRRITRAAQFYLLKHPAERNRPCRFDVVSIGTVKGKTRLDWIRNAFDAA